ncbi:MAG TPA: hypothetical protein VF607_13215 [Verrucomicrobiae bacterium]
MESPRLVPLKDFMYFVPMISPDPVTVRTNEGNAQLIRLVAWHGETNGSTWQVTSTFDFVGSGQIENKYDHTALLARLNGQTDKAGNLPVLLDAILAEGEGAGAVEIEGNFTNGAAMVQVVRLKFNRDHQASPIAVRLLNLQRQAGKVEVANTMIARVNQLSFQRTTGTPHMEVLLDSVKDAGAGDGVWTGFIGKMKAVAANLFVPPQRITVAGYQNMFDFGAAVRAKAPTFQFPEAANLR